MPDFDTVRSGKDRRNKDVEECRMHEGRLDEMATTVSKQSGWLKVGGGILTVSLFLLGLLCTNIINGQGRLEGMLSDYKVTMAEHKKDIDGLKNDMKEVQDRNRYIDQQSGMYNYSKLPGINK